MSLRDKGKNLLPGRRWPSDSEVGRGTARSVVREEVSTDVIIQHFCPYSSSGCPSGIHLPLGGRFLVQSKKSPRHKPRGSVIQRV